ncbi:MAG: hypothetical protein ACFB14_20775 [Leptolyngbyaceae cyanobacterium]
MTTLGTIAHSIIDRLTPLQAVGLIVRRQPNRLKTQGVITRNGVLTLSLESITGNDAGRDLIGIKQEAIQVWLLSGKLRNVREQDGLENLYDWLMGQLFGWIPAGASGPIALGTFTPQQPMEDYWPVELRINVPSILIGEACDGLLIDEVPEADGANFLEGIFEVVEVRDRWDVNVDYVDASTIPPVMGGGVI